MSKKRNNLGWFLLVFLVVYSLIILLSGGTGKTGQAYMSGDELPDSRSIYEFLTMAKNNPSQYLIVVGDYSEGYELEAANRISDSLGIMLFYEEDVEKDTNLILIGKPTTNLKLDKALLESFDGKKGIISVSGRNLVVAIDNEEQANKAADLISGFKNEKNRLSPSTVSFDTTTFTLMMLILLAIVLIVGISVLEIHRHNSVAKAQEQKEEHKIESLENYIKKYEEQGYNESQIKQWLVRYGYKEELVNMAMEEMKNVRADISNQAS